jgi:hypothetical protein
MAYIGNIPATGEDNSFKILDDISTYTLTFDGSSAAVVDTTENTITQNSHRFITGQRVTYTNGSGTDIGGLSDGTAYFIIKHSQNTVKLATNASNAANNIPISLTSVGTGSDHTLNVAFDSVNTKFKASYDNGTKAKISRAAQLTISMNGVIQEPQNTSSPTAGFGFDLDGVIVFSAAPAVSDVFWGYALANNTVTFDISDNTVDNFTGNNSQVDFVLSKSPANNQNVLVTLDGVVQYPSDATTTRAYSVSSNVLTFSSAPGLGIAIQVRHIGFAGATTSAVTGMYGRTGNVTIIDSDPVVAIQSGGTGIGTVRTLNFIGAGNTFAVNGNVIDISIAGGGGGAGAGGTWTTYTAGIATSKSVGVNTTNLDDPDLVGVGNSFQGLYVSNGMIIFDNTLNGNHYIGTNFSGLIAGPANIAGVLTIDGEYVVV